VPVAAPVGEEKKKKRREKRKIKEWENRKKINYLFF
jgi:hypothetical protein